MQQDAYQPAYGRKTTEVFKIVTLRGKYLAAQESPLNLVSSSIMSFLLLISFRSNDAFTMTVSDRDIQVRADVCASTLCKTCESQVSFFTLKSALGKDWSIPEPYPPHMENSIISQDEEVDFITVVY